MRKALVIVAFAALVANVASALPVPGYIYPSSMQRGTTSRILVGGMYMRAVNGAVVSGDGVKVTKITQVPGFPRSPGRTQIPWLKAWFEDIMNGTVVHQDLPAEAIIEDTDWQHCSWWTKLDERDQLELEIVSRFWYTPENYPQPTPALDQLVIVDLEVDANAKPGRRELIVHDNQTISAPHPFYITEEPHVIEPTFVIPIGDMRKTPLPYILHLPGKLPVSKPPVSFDGEVWPGEVDAFKIQLEQGKRYTFETNARELLPYLGDAVPGFFNPTLRLFDPNGKEVAFEDDYYYLPDPVLSYVTEKAGVYTLEINDNLYRGRQDFVYTIRCYEDSLSGHSYTPQKRAFECFPPPASHFPPNAGKDVDLRTGVIDCPGRVIRNIVKVGEPCTLDFELFARRMGSPLDGIVRLYGPIAPGKSPLSAPMLAEWDDAPKFLAGTVPQAMCDPRGSWTFLDAGTYCVTVTDQEGNGGEHFSYTLSITKRHPDFEIYATASTYLMRGDDAEMNLKVAPLYGFKGKIKIEGNEDFYCDEEVDCASDKPLSVTVRAKKPVKGLKTCQFFATAILDDKTKITHRITPTDSAEQAFAYTHLVPQRSFFFYNPQ